MKICGLRNASQWQSAVAAGADAVGFNFYPGSSRYVAVAQAAGWAEPPAGAARVALLVNAAVDEIRQAAAAIQADYVQLHGDEPPELLAQLSDLSLIKALRVQRADAPRVVQYVQRCSQLGVRLSGLLIDAYDPHAYGGTGRTAPWEVLGQLRAELPGLPLILAGGLTPENVAAAIQVANPDAVDTASGVETVTGEKDPARMRQFVQVAQQAFLASG